MNWKRASFLIAGAGLCAATAWLWRFGILPALPGWGSRLLETGIASMMILQAARMWPTVPKDKTHKRLLIKHETMRTGSLALIAGAALLLCGLLDGCHSQTAWGATQRFCTAVNRPAYGNHCSALTVPGPWQRDAAVWNADKLPACPDCDGPGLRVSRR